MRMLVSMQPAVPRCIKTLHLTHSMGRHNIHVFSYLLQLLLDLCVSLYGSKFYLRDFLEISHQCVHIFPSRALCWRTASHIIPCKYNVYWRQYRSLLICFAIIQICISIRAA